jgi:hypothetical protein
MNSSALTPSSRDKLIKLLGMLGSNHDGEAANAGRLANSMLKAAGATWHDVIAPPRLPAPPMSRHEQPWRRPVSNCQSVRVCLSWPQALNDWELRLLRSLAGKKSLSEKQRKSLHNIVDKVEAFVIGAGAK